LLKCFPLPIALLKLEGNASIVIVVLVAGLKIKIDMPNYTITHLIRELRQPKNCNKYTEVSLGSNMGLTENEMELGISLEGII
jgi:hypothetical protein